ncbi:MAG: hypothetical protein ACYT04_25175 [Nostoc sp.]
MPRLGKQNTLGGAIAFRFVGSWGNDRRKKCDGAERPPDTGYCWRNIS